MPSIGSLIVDTQLRLAQFTRETEQMKGQLNSIGGAARSAGTLLKGAFAAVSVAVVARELDLLAKKAADIGDLGKSFGIASEQLSRFTGVARLVGLEVADLGSIFDKFAGQVSKARGGDEGALKLMKDLGIAAEDLKAKDFGGLFQQALAQLDRFEGSDNKVALLREAFGKTGRVVDQFAEKMRTLGGDVDKLGPKFDPGITEASGKFNDQMALLALNAEKAKVALLNELLPGLNRVIQAFLDGKKAGEGFFASFASAVRAFAIGDEVEYTREQIAKLEAQLAANDRQLNARQANEERTNQLLKDRAIILRDLTSFQANLKVLTTPGLITGDTGEQKKIAAPPQTGGSGAAEALAALRAKAEQELKRLAGLVKDEEAAIAGSIEILNAMLGRNLIAFETFYSERRRLQEQGLAATIAANQKGVETLVRLRDQLPKGSDRTEIDTRIAEAQSRAEEAQRKFAQASVLGYFEAGKAAEEYAKQVAEIAAQVEELRGNVEGAARARFSAGVRDLRVQAQTRNDEGALDLIERAERATVAQAKINALLQQAGIIQDQLANSEARIRTERETGSLGELGQLRQTSVARKAALEQLRRIADAYSDIAAAQDNPVTKQQAENFRRQVDELAASADLVKQKFREIGESGLSNFFSDILDGTKSVKDAFNDMARSILQSVNRLVAQDIAGKIFGSMKGGAPVEHRNGSPGGGGITDIFASIFSGLFRARGGPVYAGMPYVVGEQGPEIFRPSVSGNIVPNGGGAGGGMTLVQHFAISGSGSDPRTQQQIGASAYQGARRAFERNG